MSKSKNLKTALIPALFLSSSLASANLAQDLKRMGTDNVCTAKYLARNILDIKMKCSLREEVDRWFIFSHTKTYERISHISYDANEELFNEYKSECQLSLNYEELQRELLDLELEVMNGEFEVSYRKESGYSFCSSGTGCRFIPSDDPNKYTRDDYPEMAYYRSSQVLLKQSVSEYIEMIYK